jgi:menaquinone-dependent protoporphyrinogen oxidase
MKILVAYASRHGSTKGIAERIAQTLENNGLEIEIKQADRVERPEQYDAFVVGSAAYAWHWLKEATAFVQRNSSLLARRPTWLFSSGPIGNEKVDAKGRDQLEAARPKEFIDFEAEIKPRDEKVFFGAYDPDAPPSGIAERSMKLFMRFMPSMKNALPIGDFRDWPAIEAWAQGIAGELKPAQPSAATA